MKDEAFWACMGQARQVQHFVSPSIPLRFLLSLGPSLIVLTASLMFVLLGMHGATSFLSDCLITRSHIGCFEEHWGKRTGSPVSNTFVQTLRSLFPLSI